MRTTYTTAAAGGPAPGYPAASGYPYRPPPAGYAGGYYPANGPAYYPQQPQQVVYVQEQRSTGIGAGGAAALGAGAGFLGGVLLADAMRPDYYAYGGTTIIGGCAALWDRSSQQLLSAAMDSSCHVPQQVDLDAATCPLPCRRHAAPRPALHPRFPSFPLQITPRLSSRLGPPTETQSSLTTAAGEATLSWSTTAAAGAAAT